MKNPLQEAQREVEGAIARGVCGAKEVLKNKFKNVQQNVKALLPQCNLSN